MRVTRLFGKTFREPPADAEMVSHQLLVRAGYIQQIAAGIFSYLPLGWRSIEKLKRIIREELDATGAQEINMPVVQPRELWEESGRADTFVPPLATFIDRRERAMVLAPTHEEVCTVLARSHLNSYRDLPVNVYHIQTKFRDEPRPRAGLLRVREFEMKDAYTFDKDEIGLDKSYWTVVDVYRRIFERCHLEVVMVEADSGVIGGKDSNEFILIAEGGEDSVLDCPHCGYAANGEKAVFQKGSTSQEEKLQVEEVHTPGVRTIEQLADFLDIPTERTLKVVFYRSGESMVVVSIRGDLEVNETKLRNALGGTDLRLATPEEARATGLVPGSASAAGIQGIRSVVDESVTMGANFVAGANREEYHLRNVNYPRDFQSDVVADIALAKDGYACPSCGQPMRERRGIEAAHVFKLGTGYSEKMHARFRDENGQEKPFYMGCYGIGVGRLLAAAIEAHHDERGIALPRSIAPYEVYLASLNPSEEAVARAADNLYEALQTAGVEVLYDDREEPPGVKFNDADLIGPPLRVVVSRRSLANNQIELKLRMKKESELYPIEDAVTAVRTALESA